MLLSLFNHPRWVAHSHRVRWNRFGYDAASTNDGIIANSDTFKHDHFCTEPTVFANRDGGLFAAGVVGRVGGHLLANIMIAGD